MVMGWREAGAEERTGEQCIRILSSTRFRTRTEKLVLLSGKGKGRFSCFPGARKHRSKLEHCSKYQSGVKHAVSAPSQLEHSSKQQGWAMHTVSAPAGALLSLEMLVSF